MVGFKNRYLVMEVYLDPNKATASDDPIVITQFNLDKAIRDVIRTNFGNIRACRAAALKCDEFKFQQYKSMAGARLTTEVQQQMQNYLNKIKVLEH